MKKKFILIVIVIFVLVSLSSIFIVSKLNNVGNLPKYQQNLWSKSFNIFMDLPDVIKSTFMIFTGKRNFSNLFNDYNVKFLPQTQYIDLKFHKKKIKFNKSSRYTFYIEQYNKGLIFVTKNGEFFRSDFQDLSSDSNNLNVEKIDIKNLEKENEKNVKILDTLIIKNKIYITKMSVYKNCKNLEIKFAEIDNILNFKSFKLFDECALIGIGAGRIQEYTFNNNRGILLSTTDSDNDDPGKRAQDDNSIFGKIVFINLNTKEYEIFSKGHRNVQGLFVKNEIILSTEHGPKGGDEINRILYKKNYGWPIASYGNPYENDNLLYKKSHYENNFEEPIFVFLPSIGISELIILPNSFDSNWMDNALVASLNGRSIYRMKFQSPKFEKILYSEKIYIGERIRDIKFIEKSNLILLALERTGSIGILSK